VGGLEEAEAIVKVLIPMMINKIRKEVVSEVRIKEENNLIEEEEIVKIILEEENSIMLEAEAHVVQQSKNLINEATVEKRLLPAGFTKRKTIRAWIMKMNTKIMKIQRNKMITV
jgi:DNA recombination-dependent growth factor C